MKHEDNDIFGIKERLNERALTPDFTSRTARNNTKKDDFTLNKSVDEDFKKKIEATIRDKSPFVNGKRNGDYIPPHFKSSISIGSSRNLENDLKTKKKFEREKKEAKFAPIDNPILGVYSKKKPINNSGLSNVGNNTQSTADDENLVCNNCLNKSVCEVSPSILNDRRLKTEADDEGGIRSRHEILSTLHKYNINSKIRGREEASIIVSKSAAKNNTYLKQKEKLINSTENKTFFLHENKEDPSKTRIMEKYNKTQMSLSKSPALKLISREGKIEVNEYYEKCVENTEANHPKGYKNDKVPTLTQYSAQLNDQIMQKAVENEKKKFIDKRQDKEYVEKVNELLAQEIKNKKELEEKRKNEFITTNNSIIQIKSRKNNIQRVKKEEEVERLEYESELERIKEYEKKKEMKLKQKISETLQKQVEEKNRKNEIEKKRDETLKVQPWINCLCESYKCCAVCRNNFHKGVLKVLAKK